MSDLCTFLFDTTTAALWAEEVAMAYAIPAEIVAAPAESDARCDLALVARAERDRALADAFGREGVPFRRWP